MWLSLVILYWRWLISRHFVWSCQVHISDVCVTQIKNWWGLAVTWRNVCYMFLNFLLLICIYNNLSILCQCVFKSVLFYLNYLVIWQNWKDYKIECFECLSFWYFGQQNLLSSLLVYLLMNLHNSLEVKHEFTYFYNNIITVFKTFVHETLQTQEIEWKISCSED